VREPRARRSPLEGGRDPRARWNPLEGGGDPRARRNPFEGARALERGGTRSRGREISSEADLTRGGVSPQRGEPCSRGRLIGPLWWAAGATAAWAVPCVLRLEVCFVCFLQVLSRVPPVFPGTLRAVLDSRPRASVGVPARLPQMLKPTDRTFFSSGCKCLPWGRVSGPAGLAPEALQERGRSCRGFTMESCQWAWYMFQPASAMFQPASVTHAQLAPFASGAS
jgi:hypothetical protein